MTDQSGDLKNNSDKKPSYFQRIPTKKGIGKNSVLEDYPHKKEIMDTKEELENQIDKLEETIKNILDNHDRDFASTFSIFMDKVRKDLKYRIDLMKRIQDEKEKLNDINTIKCERDYFRSESVRLNTLCKELKIKIDDMTIRMKILSDEVNNLTEKWKDSEDSNRQMYSDLKEALQKQQIFFKELNETRDMLNKNEMERAALEENYIADDVQKERLIAIIEKLRSELKKEKTKYQKKENEYNRMFVEDNKLKEIFIDCVEETRKNIYKRKTMEMLRQKKGENLAKAGTKYEHFLPSDKKKILEDFLFKDEVSNMISEALFSKRNEYKKLDENKKKRLNKINLPEIEDKKVEVSRSDLNTPNYMNETHRIKGIPSTLLMDESTGDPFFKTMGRINTTNYTSKNITEGKGQWRLKK